MQALGPRCFGLGLGHPRQGVLRAFHAVSALRSADTRRDWTSFNALSSSLVSLSQSQIYVGVSDVTWASTAQAIPLPVVAVFGETRVSRENS